MTPKALSREIKFRCFYNHKMYYALPAISFDEQGIKRIDLNNDDNDFDSTPDTWVLRKEGINLMQYTGLHDKNGKEIYEGDIITCEGGYEGEDCEQPSKVYFCSESLQWRVACLCGCQSYELSDYDYASVIGNIYQNPELIK